MDAHPVNPRERILAAIRHAPVDRFPTDIWATQEVWDRLGAYFGATDRLAIYDLMGIDGSPEEVRAGRKHPGLVR